MIDPHRGPSFGPPPADLLPGRAPAPGEHLDDLAAMLVADNAGSLPAQQAAAHAAGCVLCSALVAAFRSEATALAGALALDAGEADFLEEARLPALVAAWAASPVVPGAARAPLSRRWESPAMLAASLGVALAGAVGWQAGTAVLGAGMQAAQTAGAVTLISDAVIGWLLLLVQWTAQALVAISQLPLVDEPVLPLLALATLLWVAIIVAPRPATARAVTA